MSKENTIISLLKEINKNIDNINDNGGGNANLQELIVTANGEYLPADYNVDGFSKVTANVVPTNKVFISNMRITNKMIVDGYWAGELVDTSELTSLQNFFFGCSLLQSVDVSNWNVSNVITMLDAFYGCSKLQSLDVSNWNVDKVSNMSGAFAECNYLKSLDVSNWNVDKVSNTFKAFNNCVKLQSLIGNRTIDDVIANNIGALNGLKINLSMNHTILDHASLRALINGLADLTGNDTQTLTLGTTLIAKLTEEDIAIATAKNWTIA